MLKKNILNSPNHYLFMSLTLFINYHTHPNLKNRTQELSFIKY